MPYGSVAYGGGTGAFQGSSGSTLDLSANAAAWTFTNTGSLDVGATLSISLDPSAWSFNGAGGTGGGYPDNTLYPGDTTYPGAGGGGGGDAGLIMLSGMTGTSNWTFTTATAGFARLLAGSTNWAFTAATAPMLEILPLSELVPWTFSSFSFLYIPVPIVAPPASQTIVVDTPVSIGDTTLVLLTPLTGPISDGTTIELGGTNVVVHGNYDPDAQWINIQPATGTVPHGAKSFVTGVDKKLYHIDWVHEEYPMPKYVNGIPKTPVMVDGKEELHAWEPTVVRVPWGRLRITVDGVDVTFFRNKLTLVTGYSLADPFSDKQCSISFPQITAFEQRPSWLKEYANVEIRRIRADESDESNPLFGPLGHADIIFEGMIETIIADTANISVDVIGCLYQLKYYKRAPGITDASIDVGTLIPFNFNPTTRQALRMSQMPYVKTNITSKDRGQWEDVITYAAKLLNWTIMPVEGGGDPSYWTIVKEAPRQPKLVQGDRTTIKWSLTFGARGVNCSLSREGGGSPNVYYGEGEDTGGSQWRNAFPDPTGQGVFFQPLAYNPLVHPTDTNNLGQLVQTPGRVDPSLIRIEEEIKLGPEIDIKRGIEILEGERARNADPGWVGTIRLEADPEEGSRLGIKAGDNLRLRHFDGWGGVGMKIHVSAVDVDLSGSAPVVTLTVDTRFRTSDVVRLIIERIASAKNPIHHLQVGKDSNVTKDAVVAWDAYKSGFVPQERATDPARRVHITQNKKWVVVPFLASEKEYVSKVEFFTSPPCIFHVSVFNFAIGVDGPNATLLGNNDYLPVDPYTPGIWDKRKIKGHQIGWGQSGQAAGYSPGTEKNPVSGVTGRLLDEGTWAFDHDEEGADQKAYLFLAIYLQTASGPTDFWGKIYRGRSSP